MVIARALARLDGDDLVLTMRDGTVHSRIPVDDTMDPAEALERISEGTMPVRLLWTLDRTSGWSPPSDEDAAARTDRSLIAG